MKRKEYINHSSTRLLYSTFFISKYGVYRFDTTSANSLYFKMESIHDSCIQTSCIRDSSMKKKRKE